MLTINGDNSEAQPDKKQSRQTTSKAVVVATTTMTTAKQIASIDDYGVKSINDDLSPSTPEVTQMATLAQQNDGPLSSLQQEQRKATGPSDNNSSDINKNTENGNSGVNGDKEKEEEERERGGDGNTNKNNDNDNDNDDDDDDDDDSDGDGDDNDNDNNDDNGDDDDAFSYLTGNTTRYQLYGHASDSVATWQSGLLDSNHDLVVPRVNVQSDRLHRQLTLNNNSNSNRSNNHPHQHFRTESRKTSSQNIGHLRMMVCGDSGIGKTGLIHAFTVVPEILGSKLFTSADVAPMKSEDDGTKANPNTTAPDTLIMDITQHEDERKSANDIKEWYASTMMLPSWEHTEADKQKGELLVKNLCFIDTPGYGAFVDAKAVIRSSTKYLERQFQLTNDLLSCTHPTTPRMERLLYNKHGGHSHVDVCLYLILDRVKRVDIEYLRSIHQLCNVLPVIVKTDLLSREQEQQLKYKVLQELKSNAIEIYKCGHTFEQLLDLCQLGDLDVPPFAISTKFASQPKTNDSYVNVKHPHPRLYSPSCYSKLIHLKEILFYAHIDQLRQSTVNKFVDWRREQTNIQEHYRQLRQQSSAPSSSASSIASFRSSALSSSSSLPPQLPPSASTLRQHPASSNTNSRGHYHHHHRQQQDVADHSILMLDLENTAQRLATREIAERVQDLKAKQGRSVNLRMAHYISEQRQRLEQQMQDRLAQLKQSLQVMEQQEKVKMLTAEMNQILSDVGLLLPGSRHPGLSLDSKSQPSSCKSPSTLSSSRISSSPLPWAIPVPATIVSVLSSLVDVKWEEYYNSFAQRHPIIVSRAPLFLLGFSVGFLCKWLL